MTVNYNVEDSGWRLVVHRPEEEENKERGMEKVTSSAGTNSHHSDLVCVRAHEHIHTPLCLSDTLSSPPYHLLSLPQMWGMKRIGGVVFKCGNALAKSATSINTATCTQCTWVCMREHAHMHTQGKHYAIMLLLLFQQGCRVELNTALKACYPLFIIHICLQCILRLSKQEPRKTSHESDPNTFT